MKRVFFLLVLCAAACIDPFVIKLTDADLELIVDGMITDQPGPHIVKLQYIRQIDEQLTKTPWATGAIVTLYDDAGNIEILQEATPGHYQTTNTEGVIGRSYYINININGKEFQSEPDKLIPVGEILNVYYNYQLNETVSKNNYVSTTNGFELFVDAAMLPEQNDLVRWRWSSVYQVLTFPNKKTRVAYSRTGASSIVPNPPACSGWAYSTRTGLIRVGDCSCCDCWIEEVSPAPILSNPRLVNNGQISQVKFAFVEANRRIFYDKFYIQLDQLSVSPATYQFWKSIEDQKNSGSDLFQTPPVKTIGNITGINNTEKVYGLFSASSVKFRILEINRAEIPHYLPPIDTLAISCVDFNKKSTSTKPIFW